MNGTRRAPAIAALAVAALLVVAAPPALAEPPTLLSAGHESRYPTASWSLAPGAEAASIELASNPATSGDGRFVDPELSEALFGPETSWEGEEQLGYGTYHVHVGSRQCDAGTGTCGPIEWSNVLTFTIPVPVPQPGRYTGSTDFGDRIRFVLSRDLTQLTRVTVTFDLDCTRASGRLQVGLGSLPVVGNEFEVTGRLRFRGGGRLTVRFEGRLRPPRRAIGKLDVRGRLPGAGRCKLPFGAEIWRALRR